MNFWNGLFLLFGIIFIIGNVIKGLAKHKFNYFRKKYFDKLELKYGKIDRDVLSIFNRLGIHNNGLINKKIKYCNNIINISIHYNNSIPLFS